MSGRDSETGIDAEPSPNDTTADSEDDERSVAAAERVQRLRAENERLRREYGRARRAEYGRTAAGLAVVGALAVGAAVVFPSVREVLLIVGGIGLFAAVLTRFLTPEQFLPVDVAEGIYDSIDETRGSLVAELELAGRMRYVPAEEAVRLYVSQREGAPLPDPADLQSTLVVPEDDGRRGVAFAPSGKTLFREFRRTLSEPLAGTPRAAASQLSDGVSSGLELVDRVRTEVDSAGRRVTIRFSGAPFGAVDRTDHPVVSFVGVGLATGLDTAVTVVDARRDDDESVVTYTWEATTDADEGASTADGAAAAAGTANDDETPTDSRRE